HWVHLPRISPRPKAKSSSNCRYLRRSSAMVAAGDQELQMKIAPGAAARADGQLIEPHLMLPQRDAGGIEMAENPDAEQGEGDEHGQQEAAKLAPAFGAQPMPAQAERQNGEDRIDQRHGPFGERAEAQRQAAKQPIAQPWATGALPAPEEDEGEE